MHECWQGDAAKSSINTNDDAMNGVSERKGNTVITRSHSISENIHGVHAPDPVAADILRKEPEQETFVRLQFAPIGICFPSILMD